MSQQEPPGCGSIAWFAIILPVFFFWVATGFVAEWQSGELTDYVAVFFSAEVGVWFLPWYLFAAASVLAFDDEPEKATWVTRLGLLSGVVLSLTYLAAWFSRPGGNAPYFLVPVVLAGTAAWLGYLPWVWIRAIIAAIPLFGTIYATAGTKLGSHPASLPALTILGFLAGTPLWAFLVYSNLLGRAIAEAPRRPARGWSGVGVLTWIAGYLGTLALVARKMDEVYAQLPASPPESCYVATAAARGHRAIVSPKQLQRLKAAELVLRRRSPRRHRGMRAVYDRIGPSLARRLSHPLLADLAYLSLKPAEGLACCILWWDEYTNRARRPRRGAPARLRGGSLGGGSVRPAKLR